MMEEHEESPDTLLLKAVEKFGWMCFWFFVVGLVGLIFWIGSKIVTYWH